MKTSVAQIVPLLLYLEWSEHCMRGNTDEVDFFQETLIIANIRFILQSAHLNRS